MNLGEIIPLVLKASILLNVLAFALHAKLEDATYLFRKPQQLLRALLSMNVVMLIVAVLLVKSFPLHPAVEVALIALAMSPVPPLLPGKVFKAGGSAQYTIGLLTAAALLAIVLVPLSLELAQRLFGVPVGMPPSAVARIVLTTVVVPLAVGIAIHAIAPTLATNIAKPFARIGTFMLIGGALPILITALPAILSLIGNGTLVAIAVFVVAGLSAGHLLGGPDFDDRMVLARATASRHPGVAIAIAYATFPQQKLVLAAVVLYLLVSVILSIPYQKWIQRHRASGNTTDLEAAA